MTKDKIFQTQLEKQELGNQLKIYKQQLQRAELENLRSKEQLRDSQIFGQKSEFERSQAKSAVQSHQNELIKQSMANIQLTNEYQLTKSRLQL